MIALATRRAGLVGLLAGVGVLALSGAEDPMPQAAPRAVVLEPARPAPAAPAVELARADDSEFRRLLQDAMRARRDVDGPPGGNPFRPLHSPAERAPLAAAVPVTPLARPAPPEPPFEYLGQWTAGGVLTVFLAEGERSHAVRPGDTVGGTWRLERVSAQALAFVHVTLGIEQTIPLDASARPARRAQPEPEQDD